MPRHPLSRSASPRRPPRPRFGAALALGLLARRRCAAEPIKIGLVTALSGQSAQAGEAITRGLQLAIDEINAKGGLLGGRKLELVRRDDESNPAKGVIAARELIFKEKVAVLFGGLDTPVSMAIVPIVNQEKVPFMGPWAAGTRDHAERRQSELRVPRLGRRRDGRHRHAATTRRRPSRRPSRA